MYKQKEEILIDKDLMLKDYESIAANGLMTDSGDFMTAHKFLTVRKLSDGKDLVLVVLKDVAGSLYGKDFVLDYNEEFELDGFDDFIDFHLMGLKEIVKVDYKYSFADGYNVE